MLLARSYRTGPEFRAAWPELVNALHRLHEGALILPDYRYELAESNLRRVLPHAPNEIEKALRGFWQFDERFFGVAPRADAACFRWSVYSLAYLAQDELIANDLISVFAPLLGRYAIGEFGFGFARKVLATFRDDAEQLLWDIQGMEGPEQGEFFNWRGHLNAWPEDRRIALLERIGLPPLREIEIPPPDVMRVFCSGVHDAKVTRSYRRNMRRS